MEGWSSGTEADIPAPLNIRLRNPSQSFPDITSSNRRHQDHRRQCHLPLPELPVVESRSRPRETGPLSPHNKTLPQERGPQTQETEHHIPQAHHHNGLSGPSSRHVVLPGNFTNSLNFGLYPSLPDEESDAEVEYITSEGDRESRGVHEALQRFKDKLDRDNTASNQPANYLPTLASPNSRPAGRGEVSSNSSKSDSFPSHPLYMPEAKIDQHFETDCVNFIVCTLGLNQRISKRYRYDKGVGIVAERLLTQFGVEKYWHSMNIFGKVMRWDPSVFAKEDPNFASWRDDFDHGSVGVFMIPAIHS